MRREAGYLVALAALSLIVKAVGAWLNRVLVFDEWLYCVEAYHLLCNYKLPTIFPLTPLAMSPWLVIFGITKYAFLANTLVWGSLLAPLTYLLAKRFLDDELSFYLALMASLNPMFIWTSSHALTEPLFTSLALSSILLALKGSFLTAGLVGGLAYLCRYPAIILLATMTPYLWRESRRGVLLYLLGFMGVVLCWLSITYTLTGGVLQTESYSLGSLGPLPRLSLNALFVISSKVLIGLTILLVPLMPLIPFISPKEKFRVPGLIWWFIALWCALHLGYYTYQSLNVYWARGLAVASERVARWLSPMMPLALLIVFSHVNRKRMFKVGVVLSLMISVALGLYLVDYTNRVGGFEPSWEGFLEKLMKK